MNNNKIKSDLKSGRQPGKKADPEKVQRLEAADRWLAGHGGLIVDRLLGWYAWAGRDLPWRQSKDPYRIWLSEIMLQQTQVQTVIPYYEKFLQHWPALADLALAGEEQVLRQWEGLGYYSRARHLLAAARQIMEQFCGKIPDLENDLVSLPGIGEYTAGAILSIAYGQPVAAVDGNVVRVFSRLAAIPWNPADPAQRREVRQLVESLLPKNRPGDWNEALMDLGATICLPRQPFCPACPLAELCQGRIQGQLADLPLRPVKKENPTDNLIVLVLVKQNRIHVRQRPALGLLGGMYEFDWLDPAGRLPDETAEQQISRLYWPTEIKPIGLLTHKFTHRRWELAGFLAVLPAQYPIEASTGDLSPASGRWVTPAELAELPFPVALSGYRAQVQEILGRPKAAESGQT